MLPVFTEMGEQEGNTGVFSIMLTVRGVVLGWVGDEEGFYWEERV